MTPTREIGIVVGYLPADDPPNRPRELGLQRRVAFVLDTVPPDQDVDPVLYGSLLDAVREVVKADRMMAILPDSGPLDVTAPGSVTSLVKSRMSEDGEPLPLVELRRGRHVVALVGSEPWVHVGGPAPYYEKFAVPVYTREDFSGSIVTSAREVCMRCGVTVATPIRGADLFHRTKLEMLVRALRWFFGS